MPQLPHYRFISDVIKHNGSLLYSSRTKHSLQIPKSSQ